MIVADTNLVAYSVIRGPHDREVERVRAVDRHWVAPPLLRSELLNVVARYVNHRLIGRDEGLKTFRRGMSFVEISDQDIDPIGVLNLCESTQCSSYDAEFVWLARELGISLVTADEAVLAAFPDTALSFSAFLNAGKS